MCLASILDHVYGLVDDTMANGVVEARGLWIDHRRGPGLFDMANDNKEHDIEKNESYILV